MSWSRGRTSAAAPTRKGRPPATSQRRAKYTSGHLLHLPTPGDAPLLARARPSPSCCLLLANHSDGRLQCCLGVVAAYLGERLNVGANFLLSAESSLPANVTPPSSYVEDNLGPRSSVSRPRLRFPVRF